MNYEIITDSAANLTAEYVKKHNITMLPLKYYIGEQEYDSYIDKAGEEWLKNFYNLLRNKEVITTSCLNSTVFEDCFERFLSAGKDIIYFAFSSKLSATYNVAVDVANSFKEKYPDRKIYVIDTKAASMGQGLCVDYAIIQRDEGKSIDELYNWHMDNQLKIAHWFTVDDLFFLKRGGRINAATAIAGTVLGVKPVMHVDNEGYLVPVGKVRGRRQSLIALVDKMQETAINPEKQRVFIAHGDCIEDLKFVEKLIKDRMGVKEFETTYINPIIGSHSGPGTMALFFYGTER